MAALAATRGASGELPRSGDPVSHMKYCCLMSAAAECVALRFAASRPASALRHGRAAISSNNDNNNNKKNNTSRMRARASPRRMGAYHVARPGARTLKPTQLPGEAYPDAWFQGEAVTVTRLPKRP